MSDKPYEVGQVLFNTRDDATIWEVEILSHSDVLDEYTVHHDETESIYDCRADELFEHASQAAQESESIISDLQQCLESFKWRHNIK